MTLCASRCALALVASFVLAVGFLNVDTARADDALTPELMAELQSIAAAKVSPSGVYIAYVKSVPRTLMADDDGPAWAELHVMDTRDGTSRPYITGKVKVSNIGWTPDGNAIAFLSKRGDDKFISLYAIPVNGGEARRLVTPKSRIREYSFSPDGSQVAYVSSDPQPKGKDELEKQGFKAIIYEEENPFRRVRIAQLDPAGGEATEVRTLELEGSASVIRWSPVDQRIAVALAPTPLIDDHYMYRRLSVVDANTGDVAAIIPNPGKLGDVQWSPDGKYIAMLSGHDIHDPSEGRLMVTSADGAQFTDVLPELFETGQVENIAWKDAKTVMYVASLGVWTMLGQVGADASGNKTLVEPGGPILWNLSLSKDGRTAAFTGDSPEYPRELFLMDRQNKQPTRVTVSNPWLEDLRLAKQEPVTYTARDGTEIEGILIRPRDEEAGASYPLVMYVHGGPESHHRNGWLTRYSAPGQMIAARGVAVFHTNYRGSTGYGVPFSKADHGDFAGAEFDDLIDAVDHLVGTGLVDTEKVGVTGGSYGGYATAWLTTYYSERIAAGVMFVGISDGISKFGTSDIPEEMFLVHQRKRTFENWDFFLERSPIYHAGQAQSPLLIMHGKDDPRVNVGQSMEMYRHVKTRTDTPVRLVLYPGEEHGNRKAAARYDYNLRMMRWLETYLKGSPAEMPPYEIDYEEALGGESTTKEPEQQTVGK